MNSIKPNRKPVDWETFSMEEKQIINWGDLCGVVPLSLEDRANLLRKRDAARDQELAVYLAKRRCLHNEIYENCNRENQKMMIGRYVRYYDEAIKAAREKRD